MKPLSRELLEVTLLIGHSWMHVVEKREAGETEKYAHCEAGQLCERLMGWNVGVQ